MQRIKQIFRNEQGISGIVFALSLGMLVGIAAITVDIGRAFVTQSELQNIADSAALAAGQQLGQQYAQAAAANNGTIPTGWTADLTGIVTAAQGLSVLHSAGGLSGITLDGNDVVVGVWDEASHSVDTTGGLVTPNAVSVQARRDGTANGAIVTFFARALSSNHQTMDVTRIATAALGPAITALPGTINAPFGISEEWFKGEPPRPCNDAIRFSPANDPLACAGWHAFDEVTQGSNPNSPAGCGAGGTGGGGSGGGSANAKLLRTVIDCMAADNYTSPGVNSDTIFDFTNGEVANAFDNLYNLYDTEADHDVDGNPTTWEIVIPVYESTDCGGPSGPLRIVSIAHATVTNVDVDNRIIDANVTCDAVIPNSRSGAPGTGGGISPLGTIPNLVS
jgi:Flp pilus assembly protein TadG